jgi:hypothetical protein
MLWEMFRKCGNSFTIVVSRKGVLDDLEAGDLIRGLDSHHRVRTVELEEWVAKGGEDDGIIIFLEGHLFDFRNAPWIERLKREKRMVVVGVRSSAGQDPSMGSDWIGCYAARDPEAYRQWGAAATRPVLLLPASVDLQFFRPQDRGGEASVVRVGWTGAVLKGRRAGEWLERVLEPALKGMAGVQLVATGDANLGTSRSARRDYYRQVDVLIADGESVEDEAIALEAAASGIPLLAVPRGNLRELVCPGINGDWIGPDARSIRDSLGRLQGNPGRLRYLRESMAKAILPWDCRERSREFKNLLNAVMWYGIDPEQTRDEGALGRDKVFLSSADLYLASADRMSLVLDHAQKVAENRWTELGTFATVIGGLSGLNYLAAVKPREIVFFDINLHALEYTRLVCELIRKSSDHRNFISRIFGRSVDRFLEKKGDADLTVENQEAYLLEPIDRGLFEETIRGLSTGSRTLFKALLVPRWTRPVLDGAWCCRRLLPCWPPQVGVPVTLGQKVFRYPSGEEMPNTNTFFYGQGWLGSAGSFLRVRANIEEAVVRICHFDLLRQDLASLVNLSSKTLLHISNIDDWFPAEMLAQLDRWVLALRERQGRLAVIRSQHGVSFLDVDPHAWAFAAIRPRVWGRAVEVTRKVPWGFQEIPRTSVALDAYLKNPSAADVTILHTLWSEGIDEAAFDAAVEQACSQSQRVLVLEHNPESVDWRGQDVRRWLVPSALGARLEAIGKRHGVRQTAMQELAGLADGKRNLLVTLDKVR